MALLFFGTMSLSRRIRHQASRRQLIRGAIYTYILAFVFVFLDLHFVGIKYNYPSFHREYLPVNAAAVQAWAQRDFDRAIQLDPDFGSAWRDLIQSQAPQPALAAETAGRALARSTLRSPPSATSGSVCRARPGATLSPRLKTRSTP